MAGPFGIAVRGLGMLGKLGKKKINRGEGAIKSVKPGKNLARKRKEQDSIIKTREKVMKEYGIKDSKTRTKVRTRANQPKINKKMSEIIDR